MIVKKPLNKSTLYILFGFLIVFFIFIFAFFAEHEVAIESIELEGSPKEIAEIINTKGKDLELLTFMHEDWTYLYYQIPLGYYSVDIKIAESQNHYLARGIVRYAANDQYVDTYKLVRFKQKKNKTIEFKEIIEVPELVAVSPSGEQNVKSIRPTVISSVVCALSLHSFHTFLSYDSL